MRELIGSGIQFPISQLLIFKDHRCRVRDLFNLVLKQLVDTLVIRKQHLGIIPFNQQFMLFRLQKNIKFLKTPAAYNLSGKGAYTFQEIGSVRKEFFIIMHGQCQSLVFIIYDKMYLILYREVMQREVYCFTADIDS